MASTAITYINSPVLGTTYHGGNGTKCIPNSGTSITVEVRSYAGASGTGGFQTVGTLTAIVRDETANISRTTINGGPNVNGTQAVSSLPNGTDVYNCWGSYSTSGSPGSISLQVITYTGQPFVSLQIFRASAWGSATNVFVRRSGAWTSVSGNIFVFRSGSWTLVA